MASFIRRRLVGGAMAAAIFGLIACGTATAVAQDATPVATPEATPEATPVAAVVHPAHIHSGTCEALGEVVHPLADVAEPAQPAPAGVIPVAVSVTRVEASLDEILGAPHAINVHQSYEEIGAYIACGNLGGTPTNGDLLVGLMELNDSGYAGVAWLHDNGDGSTTVSVFLAQGLLGQEVIQAPTPEATPEGTPAPEATPAS